MINKTLKKIYFLVGEKAKGVILTTSPSIFPLLPFCGNKNYFHIYVILAFGSFTFQNKAVL